MFVRMVGTYVSVSIPLFSGLVTDEKYLKCRFGKMSQSLCFQGWLLTFSTRSVKRPKPSQSLCFQGWLLTQSTLLDALTHPVSIPLFSGLVTDCSFSNEGIPDVKVSIPLFSGLVTDKYVPWNSLLDLSQSLCFQGWLLTSPSASPPLA